ncbi:hypothetical protein AFIC_000840 [[Pseudomonas] carboxydohydrogena]|uniref:DUF2946 domain-containing protein n=1 Tax=Afipia carboxydohydrogena TaxID=290 RepID=A0ABY8BQT4_AFICR|nr:hypothetical protein [[Pseudomonas] carboxydohydrogena]WEF52359.1 hypothetical protein AFIC_000840 [[Pseudomonas] carboxydohydrogena]
MIGLLRYILAGCLVLALIASGVPHIRVAAAAPVQQAVHMHADAHASAAQHDAMPAMHMHSESRAPAEKSADSCKDMKCCAMCATAYVEPVSRALTPARIALAVRYGERETRLADAAIFPDPRIPIAA